MAVSSLEFGVEVGFMGLVEFLEPKPLPELHNFYAEKVLKKAGLKVFGKLNLEFPEDPVAAEKFAGLIFGEGKLKELVLSFVGDVCRDALKHYLDDFNRLRFELERLGNLEGRIKVFHALRFIRQYSYGEYLAYPPRVELIVGGLESQPLTILCATDVYFRDPIVIIPLGREGLKMIPKIEEASKHVRRQTQNE